MTAANIEHPASNTEHRDDTMTELFLICPSDRPEIGALSESVPLVNLNILGKSFLHHWLDHLASCGFKEITILAADRPEQIRASVGDGARWGLRIETIPQSHELTCAEARSRFSETKHPSAFLQDKFILIDHLPDAPEAKLFLSYASFFSAVQTWLFRNPVRTVGVKEIQPGIWIGLRSRISPHAKLHAPCWIGENVIIQSDTEIGPMAVLENDVVVERGAMIQQSWIAQQTFVGSLTQIKDSFALGNTLINFRINSVAKIPDPFLLCALQARTISVRSGNLFGRVTALLLLLLTLPFALVTLCKAKWYGHRPLRPRHAVPSLASKGFSSILYYEFTNANGWWKRWPQLWNVVKGDFAWIGNRPLTSIDAGKLANEFERLWLAAPIGLISQGDAEGCRNLYSDEARAHASYYAVSANWRLDLSIFLRALKRLIGRKLTQKNVNESGAFKETQIPLAAKFR